ncbi:PREDICTED: 25-hydroxycholesterol 7-alpha-hydroxylase-like, partial [Nestor notabilis]|uniref:25-hydroxycholesterol 7-alpha-hydroxylase-like n=1 Tax=Nestor notabilis TaxID=176057 RepID=UPI000523627B
VAHIAAINAGMWEIVSESYLCPHKYKDLPAMGGPENCQEPVALITVADGTWAGKWCGVAVCAEEPAGRVLKPCQLNRGAMVSTQKKAVGSLRPAPTMADTAIQTELRWAHDATRVWLRPVPGSYTSIEQKSGEPPLINGWIPYLGKALIFRKDAFKFLLDQQKKLGDIFTVHIAGRYITFIMDPFQYVYVIRNSKQLEFHEFADKMASKTFDYPALSKGKFPDLKENLHRIYQYLQGKPLDIISDHMMKNLQDIFEWKCSQATDWETEKMYKFCCSVMFEASFVTLYGRVPAADGHKVISEIRDKFIKFDASFPYLAANIPIELLGATKKVRKELIHHFLLQNMTKWLGGSKVVQARQDIFEKYELLGDYDKA